MTKAELEIKYKEALEKIEEQKYLASAVDAKDRELAQMMKSHQEELELINKRHQEELKRAESKIESNKKDISDSYERRINFLETENGRRVKELDQLLRVHGALLKSLQGTIDNSIELNEFIFNRITGGK